mmetsp:Transcript_26630/g.39563  ORF Transcript_26630/g.39563 Transcript_26630/m.39563 type:complete len:355 (-) Transcript_26630:200-1264(-)
MRFTANHASIIGAYIGGIGAIVIIFSYYRYEKLRKTISRKLICNQSLALLILSIAIICFPSKYISTCMIQAVLSEYSFISGMLWAGCISYMLLKLMRTKVSRMQSYKPENDMPTMRIFCFIGSIPLSVIPFITEDYGKTRAGWCWIEDTNRSGRYLRTIHYVTVWVVVVGIVIASVDVYYKLASVEFFYQGSNDESLLASSGAMTVSPPSRCVSTSVDTEPVTTATPPASQNSYRAKMSLSILRRNTKSVQLAKESAKAMYNRLVVYPLLLLLIWLPISIYRFWQLFGFSSDPPGFLIILGIFLLRIHGMLNLIIFAGQRSVLVEWKKDYQKLTSWISGKTYTEPDCGTVDYDT